MSRAILYIITFLLTIHGLIHLMGFVAYWPLAKIAELPYKNRFLNGRLHLNQAEMRLFAFLWLATAVIFIIATISLVTQQPWWYPLLWAAATLSLIVTMLDWGNAFRGTLITAIILVVLLLMLGLRIKPAPFSAHTTEPSPMTHIPLPADLPPPVARYFQTISGEQVPVIETAVITTRGTLRFANITFPARLRFTHNAGQGYRHDIEATFFGYPLMKVDETYIDGHARMALPMGVVENEPKIDMAANLGLWGESIWLPSIFVTDPRVRWEAINGTTARLIVPFGNEEDSFTVYFDAETGLINYLEAMRYREATNTEKIEWRLDVLAWDEFNSILIPSTSTATWADDSVPWLVVEIEDIAYNVDVHDAIGEGLDTD